MMVVPDSFGAWESAKADEFNEECLRDCAMQDRLEELNQKLKEGTLTLEEDQMIDRLQDAIADNELWRQDEYKLSRKIDRARGNK